MIDQLILIRHGETMHNVAGIAQGWGDSALSPKGELQVQRLAQRLRTAGINALYSSPLQRALTTAEAIADATGLPIRILDELREMNYGAWEGRSFLEVRRDDAASYEQWVADPEVSCPQGGESHGQVQRRLQQAFRLIEEAADACPEGQRLRPAVVTHGTAIRLGATVLLDLPVMASRHFAQDNASINLFLGRRERSGVRYVLKRWNDTSHCHDGG
ncbi:MAG: Phosphoglycerate mutase [Acidobacteria bacterium]|nr:Phosphoglycerate mutase [Acidobacteriota bacterium]